MRQVFNLMKKDFLLIRKVIPLMVAALFFALINLSRGDTLAGTVLYGTLVGMLTLMIYSLISMEEIKLKGHIYLASTPMQNINIGLAKFFIVTATFIIVTVIYVGLSNLNLSLINLGRISIYDIVIAFFLIETFFVIYIPLTFKLGFTKLQAISFGMIFITPIILPFILKNIGMFVNIKNNILDFPLPVLILSGIIFLVITTMITGMVSASILDGKEY